MVEQPGYYGFSQADRLESVLKQAADKVAVFAGLRDKLIVQDLGCWSGRKYDDWSAGDFGTGQLTLRGYVGRLRAVAAQVHNATVDAWQFKYGKNMGPKVSTAVEPATGPAPPNHHRTDGLASAIPSYLFDYSNQTATANTSLLGFITGTVQGAVTDYYSGPASTSTCPNFTPPIQDLCANYQGYAYAPILAEIQGTLHDMGPTDAFVATVGDAFELADPTPTHRTTHVPSTADMNPEDDKQITIADGLLNAAVSQEEGDDQALQGYLRDTQDAQDTAKKFADDPASIDWVLQQIDAHKNDPVWLSAFFNALSQQQMNQLFSYVYPLGLAGRGHKSPSTDLVAALMQVYDHGTPSDALSHEVVQIIVVNPTFTTKFFADLAASGHKAGAYAFIASLDNGDLQYLLAGNWHTLPTGSADWDTQSANQKQIFQILLNAAHQVGSDPYMAQLFLKLIGDAMSGVTSQDPQGVLKAVGPFLTYCMWAITPVAFDNALGPEGGDAWAAEVGTEAGTLMDGFIAWLSNSEEANNAQNDMWAGIVDSLVADVIEGFATGGLSLPFSTLANMGVSVGENIATTTAESIFEQCFSSHQDWNTPTGFVGWVDTIFGTDWLKDANVTKDAVTMADFQLTQLCWATVYQLILSGQVQGPYPSTATVDLTSSANFMGVWNDPSAYTIKGGFHTVADILNGVEDKFRARLLASLSNYRH